MRIKIIKVPTGETFYFCKQFMFHLAGTDAATFVAKFDDKGYTGYPYHPDGNTSMLFTFITAKNKAETVKIII